MWIRRIEVRHCAGIAEGAVDLQRGFNVLHGPNELGKSTLVRALRYAFLLPAKSSLASSLQDWNAQEPPEVSVTFEDDDGRVWRVRKTFSTNGGKAFLDASRDGEHFDTDARGREVDGRLQEILRWGIEAPGGKKGRRGMPSSLIATALLSDQSDVEAILGQSLADDADDSGRDRLTEALHALAEDPRFKQIVDIVQARVDEAFTPTGRKRGGRDRRGGVWRRNADGPKSGSGTLAASPRTPRASGHVSRRSTASSWTCARSATESVTTSPGTMPESPRRRPWRRPRRRSWRLR